MERIKVRFAPSPTGPLHIGGARSALFNWLIARKLGGTVLLRIEDTDRERSSRESEDNILKALEWLGIDWDEGIVKGGAYGPYRQTERLAIYDKIVARLLAQGNAYHCYCSEEDLEAEREVCLARGEVPMYSGKCRNITSDDRVAYESKGVRPVIRFRVPADMVITVKDLVRGEVSFESNGIGDFVIVKSDGIPTYNFAVVADDAAMGITHVIRGEEHLSNTPRQIMLYHALDWELPQFAHVSLILGKDRSKMSKRHGSTAVEQYQAKGYLPEAVINFLALLGWSPVGEQEIFSIKELIQEFSLDRVAKNPAVFDLDKLNHINAHYLKQKTTEELVTLAIPFLREAGYIKEGELTNEEYQKLQWVIEATREYLSYMAQIVQHIDVFFKDDLDFASEEAKAVLVEEQVPDVLSVFEEKIAETQELNPENVKMLLKGLTKELGLGGKKVYMPIRVALSGQQHGPEMHYMIPILGHEGIKKRIKHFMDKL